jgi:hypothetical protein
MDEESPGRSENVRKQGHLKRIIFRGDQEAYASKDGMFRYVDQALLVGATGLHMWFWGDDLRRIRDPFFSYCRERGIGIHLGIGVGAYGVCDGEDPCSPEVQRKIQKHVENTLKEFDLEGIEFQTGEYDGLAYRGESTRGKSLAAQVVEQLNPLVDFTLQQKEDLWVRTELNTDHFDEAGFEKIAKDLTPGCAVEWSRFTGPYRGPDAFERGRRILSASERFSWFLKIHYGRTLHWKEIASDRSRPQMRLWAEHWRGWISLLRELHRETLTICNVGHEKAERDPAITAAAVALAADPDLSIEELLRRFF